MHQLRKQVVRLRRDGIKIMQVVAMTRLSYPPVRAAIDLFEAGGWSAIRPALCGRLKGDGRGLSPVQRKMDFHLWSRAAVGQRIEQKFGIQLQVRSIGKYHTCWSFTPQKPIKRANEQSPAAVQTWLKGRVPSDRATQHKTMPEKAPERVMRCLQDRRVRYAAEYFTGQE